MYPKNTRPHGNDIKNQKTFVAGKGTYNLMARALWANMCHISRNKFRKRPMPSWVWPPVTTRNGMHIHVINSWFEPKKIIQGLSFFPWRSQGKTTKMPCVIFIVVCPPSRHTTHERARRHTIFTRWFTAYTTHDENLAKASVQLTPKILSTTGQNISLHPVFQFGAKNGFKITHCRYNSFWFLVLRALIYNSSTKKKMQKISYMLMKKKSIRSPPPYPLRLLTQDCRPRPE